MPFYGDVVNLIMGKLCFYSSFWIWWALTLLTEKDYVVTYLGFN